MATYNVVSRTYLGQVQKAAGAAGQGGGGLDSLAA